MQQLYILFLIFFISAYWIDTIRVKEIARAVCKKHCLKQDVQLLDNTVVKQKTFLRKQPHVLFAVFRQYSFDYSIDGEIRNKGLIVMRGHHLHEIQLDLHTYDNVTHL